MVLFYSLHILYTEPTSMPYNRLSVPAFSSVGPGEASTCGIRLVFKRFGCATGGILDVLD